MDDQEGGPVVALGEERLHGLVEQLRVRVLGQRPVREHIAHGPGRGLGVRQGARDLARGEEHAIGGIREDHAALVAEVPGTGRDPVLRGRDDAPLLVHVEGQAPFLVVADLLLRVQHAAVERLGAVALRHPDAGAEPFGGSAEQVEERRAVGGGDRGGRGSGTDGGRGAGVRIGAREERQGEEHDRTDGWHVSHGACSPDS